MKKRKFKKMLKRIKNMSMKELDKFLEETKIAIEKKKQEGKTKTKMSKEELAEIDKLIPEGPNAKLEGIDKAIEEKKIEEETK